MILELFVFIFVKIQSFFELFLPSSNPLRLPWGTDDILAQGVSGYKILAQSFPPFTVVLNAFLIYLVFRIVMRVFRMIPIIGKTID